jgi:hypothetical protein
MCALCGGSCLTQATSSALSTRLSNITTVTTGQKTICSVTQSDLMMGVKTPEIFEEQLITDKSLIVASSWSRLYLP